MIALGFFLRKPTKTNKNRFFPVFLRKPTKTNKNRFFPEKTDKNQQKPVFS